LELGTAVTGHSATCKLEWLSHWQPMKLRPGGRDLLTQSSFWQAIIEGHLQQSVSQSVR